MSDGEDVQRKATLKERLTDLFEKYGRIAIYTYFCLSILAILGFTIAFAIGTAPEGTSGVLGVIIAGWVAAKVLLPLRILATLALTPVISVAIERLRNRRGGPPAAPSSPAL